MTATATPAQATDRHTLIILGMAIQRALEAWDSTPLHKASDGRLQEAMESLRAAATDYRVSTEYAIQVFHRDRQGWLAVDGDKHCFVKEVHKCQRFATLEEAEKMASHLRELVPQSIPAVRAVAKLVEGAL